MGGLFPERLDLTRIHDILDIGCGPGGWVLDVAREYPEKQVVGIDISTLMVEYARYQAYIQGLNNVSFSVMNALEPLDFRDSSFDMVNARFVSGFMPPVVWSRFMQECLRIMRPGGVVRLTEPEYPLSNSLVVEKLGALLAKAMQVAGQSFSPDGRHAGITPMLGRFLRDAGCQDIQKVAYVLDSSMGTEEHLSQYQNTMVFLKLVQPFILKMELITQEEVDQLYQRALTEMMSDDYCSLWYFLSAWGVKP
jgi:ubiquinone/menaquinone biosynthesis C-methylase UbiE